MRTTVLAAWLALATVPAAWAQHVQPPRPEPRQAARPAPHGASGAPAPSVNPAPPTPPPPHAPPTSPSPPTEPPGLLRERRSPFDAGPFTYAPRYGPSQPWPPRYWGSGWPTYGAPYEVVPPPAPRSQPPGSTDDQRSLDGVLELEIEPGTADVYVDGFHAGTADDVASSGLVLRAGRHSVDLRAPGYDALTVQVTIAAGQHSRYRRELVPAGGVVPSAVRPAPAGGAGGGRQTIYVIPGCFAGNRLPAESTLPQGCDIRNLRASRP